MFKTYLIIEDKKTLLGDSNNTVVFGMGDVELTLTSGKTLLLKDFLHTLEMMNNLVSGFLLNKAGFTQIIWAYKYTITKNGTFVWGGYAIDGREC